MPVIKLTKFLNGGALNEVPLKNIISTKLNFVSFLVHARQ